MQLSPSALLRNLSAILSLFSGSFDLICEVTREMLSIIFIAFSWCYFKSVVYIPAFEDIADNNLPCDAKLLANLFNSQEKHFTIF